MQHFGILRSRVCVVGKWTMAASLTMHDRWLSAVERLHVDVSKAVHSIHKKCATSKSTNDELELHDALPQLGLPIADIEAEVGEAAHDSVLHQRARVFTNACRHRSRTFNDAPVLCLSRTPCKTAVRLCMQRKVHAMAASLDVRAFKARYEFARR